MQIFNDLKQINNSSLALGYFDAVHSAHAVVLKNAVNVARKNNTKSVVMTFSEHPLMYLNSAKPEEILTIDEKTELFEKYGIDCVFILDFKKIADLSAEDYIEKILYRFFTPTAITTGFNHTFGRCASGNPELLRNLQNKFGYKYYEIPPYVIEGETVSCTNIRNKISDGEIFGANKLLGYNFFISGIVVEGEHIARKLGFPSANIVYPEGKIRIPYGVYYAKADVEGETFDGILNYGYGKTTGNFLNEKTEVHLLNFDGNIYNKPIKINIVTKIRNQNAFDSVEKLKEQIKRDIAFAEIYKKFEGTKIEIGCKKFGM